MPAELVSSFDLWPTSEPYAAAFRVLSAGRSYGLSGPLPIQYSELVVYAQVNGFADSRAELEEFIWLVQSQDALYLEHAAKKASK